MAGRAPRDTPDGDDAGRTTQAKKSAKDDLATPLPPGVDPDAFEGLLQRGRDRGVLTQEDLVEVVREVELSPELIVLLVERVRAEGIVFESEDGEDGPDGKPRAKKARAPTSTQSSGPPVSSNGSRPKSQPTRSRAQGNGEYVGSGATEDPVHTYLKEIGKVELLSAELEVEMAMRIEEGLAAVARLAASEGEGEGEPSTDPVKDRRLVRKGQQAKEVLIEANLRLVVSIAKRYRNRGLAI
ncbi:MAG: sigma-70 factor domain-containing protein, partial [Acidimicrobiales bacterium]